MQASSPFGSPSTRSSFFRSDLFNRVMGFSLFAGLFQAGVRGLGGGMGAYATQGAGMNYIWSSAALFVLGLLIETGRRFCQWLIERVRFQYSITAHFTQGDPAYEWLIHFLTEKQVWKSSREFRASATSSFRKWGVKPDGTSILASASGKKLALHLPFLADLIKDTANLFTENSEGKTIRTDRGAHAEYVPTFEAPQLFRWRGYWAEIRRTNNVFRPGMVDTPSATMMYLTIYTRDMSVLSSFVEEARLGYLKTSRPHVTVHSAENSPMSMSLGNSIWNKAKTKIRRPLSSIILQDGAINSLVKDACEFLESEDWYIKAGIPHRRGYLLYGPPGTGKSSTIYALAGELGLEIFAISLAAKFVDDAFLAYAVASIPKHSIFLIEDIDCAFPYARDDEDEGQTGMLGGGMLPMIGPLGRSAARRMPSTMITLSGLLNVLDGVGSEEGKIFFATTNHIEHLDPALLRPGRIDRKVQYKLATQAQAEALFLRFYPEELIPTFSSPASDAEKPTTPIGLPRLASLFASSIPEHEFSTAELQGFLLTHKKDPFGAVSGASAWVTQEQHDRAERKRKEAEKEAKAKAKREEREANALKGPLSRLGLEAGGAAAPNRFVSEVVALPDTAAAVGYPATKSAPSSKVNGIAEGESPDAQEPSTSLLNGPGVSNNTQEHNASEGSAGTEWSSVNGRGGKEPAITL